MKLCASCQNKYPDDANFCPREECASPDGGPYRLTPIEEPAPGRFLPISRLGGGASGEVWQANDSQTGNAVAYKVATAGALPSAIAVDRALRELRQLQRTSSPRIVKVVDFGKTPEGRVFVASELAQGEPLDQVVGRSGPFALERAKRVVAQIGEALLDAQKVGVVHRDLAAKNVLVSGDDEVRIINFAIARPFSETILGVPEFMSPEQAEGKLVDQRSNTYGVGALLYFMLTGQAPYVGSTPQATVDAILKADLTPPSVKRPGVGLTTEVDRVVLKALERSSSRRPLTLRQFLSDVATLVVTEQQTSAAAAAAAGGSGKDPAFARTMVFAGGSQDVQKLVAQAVAAREAASTAAPPTGAGAATTVGMGPSPARSPTPPPTGAPRSGAGLPTGTPPPATGAPRPSHGAAVAATMLAMPAAPSATAAPAAPVGTPRPTAMGAAVPPANQTPPIGAANDPGGTNFRETLWFKKGDVDQMVADARAKVAAMAEAKKTVEETSGNSAIATGDNERPLEDRYLDDGTLTADDRKKFSLRRGSGPNQTTQSSQAASSSSSSSQSSPVRSSAVPGDRMSDSEVFDEIGGIGGRKRITIIGIAGAVAAALVAVVVVTVRGKGKGEGEKPAAAASAPAPIAPPTPLPLPPPAERAEPGPASAGREGDAGASRAPAARKKPVVKKKPTTPTPKKPHR